MIKDEMTKKLYIKLDQTKVYYINMISNPTTLILKLLLYTMLI